MRYYKQSQQNEIPNFAEIAILICHATQIYCRKVDWLYNFMNQINVTTSKAVQLCETTKQKAAEENETLEKKKKERKQRSK